MKENIRKRLSLTLSLVLFVFAVMAAAMLLGGLAALILHYTGALSPDGFSGQGDDNHINGIFAMTAASILLGTAITAFFSRKALKPIRKVIDATHRVAEGDFGVRVELKGVYELEKLSESFNKMVQELSNTETLRSDFINSFSHEFKTPIVSVRGFAKLLKENGLAEDEKQEYLDIIIAESERLAELSSNILSLSKYESLEIITDRHPFRLDEQIRRVVVLSEGKWLSKKLELTVSLDEITFIGNADLTQQIWINLLDNAVKFTDAGGSIRISLSECSGEVLFVIEDDGIGIDRQALTYVFDRFFQGDNSHKTGGNGLGLAIVKKIVQLCGGSIQAESEEGRGSVFSVRLPNKISPAEK